jgi:hypothetical protein
VSIDKVVIQGAEFTRVAGRYLLQTEVERAMAQQTPFSPHIDRLTTLLEDMVRTADEITIALAARSTPSAARDNTRDALIRLRQALEQQIAMIDGQLGRSGR